MTTTTKILSILLLLIFSTYSNAQNDVILKGEGGNYKSQREAEKKMEDWMKRFPTKYELQVEGEEAKASIESYYMDRTPAEPMHLLRIRWKGMLITLRFKKPVKDIEWTKESLEKEFDYLSIYDIYHGLELKDWKAAPQTPVNTTSSLKNIDFQVVEDGKLELKIDWSIYGFWGYATCEDCARRMPNDGPAPSDCVASARGERDFIVHVKTKLN